MRSLARLALLLLTSLLVTAPAGRAHAADAAGARSVLRRAINHYSAGEYGKAASILGVLVEAEALRDRADQLEALRIYGIASYLVGKKQRADFAFRALLRRDPKAKLDPSFVRPEVVKFFEKVRREVERERRRTVREHGPRGSAAVNLLPPWGQFRNGHRTKGFVILGLELGLVATSIATAAVLYSQRDDTGLFPFSRGTYNALLGVNVGSVIALGAVLLYGAIDGLYYYYRAPELSAPAKLGGKRARSAARHVSLAPNGVIVRF